MATQTFQRPSDSSAEGSQPSKPPAAVPPLPEESASFRPNFGRWGRWIGLLAIIAALLGLFTRDGKIRNEISELGQTLRKALGLVEEKADVAVAKGEELDKSLDVLDSSKFSVEQGLELEQKIDAMSMLLSAEIDERKAADQLLAKKDLELEKQLKGLKSTIARHQKALDSIATSVESQRSFLKIEPSNPFEASGLDPNLLKEKGGKK